MGAIGEVFAYDFGNPSHPRRSRRLAGLLAARSSEPSTPIYDAHDGSARRRSQVLKPGSNASGRSGPRDTTIRPPSSHLTMKGGAARHRLHRQLGLHPVRRSGGANSVLGRGSASTPGRWSRTHRLRQLQHRAPLEKWRRAILDKNVTLPTRRSSATTWRATRQALPRHRQRHHRRRGPPFARAGVGGIEI